MMTGLLLPFGPAAVEIGFELLTTCDAELVSGVGVSTLGDAEGSTEASGEGLAGASVDGREGGTTCCGALELELVVLELSCVV